MTRNYLYEFTNAAFLKNPPAPFDDIPWPHAPSDNSAEETAKRHIHLIETEQPNVFRLYIASGEEQNMLFICKCEEHHFRRSVISVVNGMTNDIEIPISDYHTRYIPVPSWAKRHLLDLTKEMSKTFG